MIRAKIIRKNRYEINNLEWNEWICRKHSAGLHPALHLSDRTAADLNQLGEEPVRPTSLFLTSSMLLFLFSDISGPWFRQKKLHICVAKQWNQFDMFQSDKIDLAAIKAKMKTKKKTKLCLNSADIHSFLFDFELSIFPFLPANLYFLSLLFLSKKLLFWAFLPTPLLLLRFFCVSFSFHLLSPSWITYILHCSSPSKDLDWMSHWLTICCPQSPAGVSRNQRSPLLSVPGAPTDTHSYIRSHARRHFYSTMHKN